MSSNIDLLLQRPELEALVVSTDDPKSMLRVQVRVFGLFDGVPDSDLPWATYKLPVGARAGEGDFTPVRVGDIVWVDFPYYMHSRKDTRRPRVTASVHHCPNGMPNLPSEAYAGETYSHKRSHNETKPSKKPAHDTKVYICNGIMVEFENGGVYRVTHQSSGTAFELDARGNSILHTEGNDYRSATGNAESHTNGNETDSVGGSSSKSVGGYWRIKVSGDAFIDAKSIKMNKPKSDCNVFRGCDVCLLTGTPHGQGSKTVLVGD